MDHEPTPGQNFAVNMKALREERQWSQGELARLMKERGFKWYPATVYSVEQGDRKLPLDEALALTDLLNTPLSVMTATPRHLGELALLARATDVVGDLMARLARTIGDLKAARDTLREIINMAVARGVHANLEGGPMEIALARAIRRLEVSEPEGILKDFLPIDEWSAEEAQRREKRPLDVRASRASEVTHGVDSEA